MGAVNPQALRSWQEKYAKLEIDVEQFLQNSHITVVGGNIRSAADAAGTVFDIAQTINEQRRGQALGQLYHRMYDEACAQLQNGSIDGYEARLFELLALMTNMDMPADQLATFRIIVNSAPGLTREAAQCMPEAVPLLFGRQATAMIYLMLSRVFFHRQRVELLSQIIRQQGDRGFSLCFLSRSWSARRTPGFLILNGPTVRGISWMLDSHLGAVHEHTNDLDIVRSIRD